MKHFNFVKRALIPMFIALVAAFPALAQPMSGTYTVGGASPNYATVAAAVNAINNNTIAGPVIINIRPGTYTEQATINTLTGANATNTVTIQAESGPGTVTIQTTGSSSSNNFIFRLNSSNWVTIKDLTLSNNGTTYGTDIEYIGNPINTTVNNCVLTGNTATSTSQSKSRVQGYYTNTALSAIGVGGSNNKVINCSFPAGCSFGVYLYGNTGGRPSNYEVSNCTMAPYYGSIYANYVNDIKFNNNVINKNTAGTGSYLGIYMYDCDSTMQIMNNTQVTGTLSSTYYGLYQMYCDGSAAKKQIVSGNTFNCASNSSTSYTTYVYYCQHDSIVNNNFSTTTTSVNYTYLLYSDYMTIKGNTFNCTSNSTNYAFYRMYGLANTSVAINDRIENNTITGTSPSSGTVYCYDGYYATNATFKNNNITLTSATGSAVHYYYYPQDYEYSGNTINVTANSSGSAYGLYYYHNSGNTNSNGKFFNNKIKAYSATGLVYGLLCYYAGGIQIYNNSLTILGGGSTTTYGFAQWYAVGNIDVYNNSFYDGNTSTSTGHYSVVAYNYSGYPNANVKWRNNAFIKANTAGRFLYTYDNNTIYNNFDYNNFYAPPGAVFHYQGNTGGTIADFPSWKASTPGQNQNSLSYMPAFVNAANGDLTPDVTNPACWALHGRGIHIAGNNMDITGSNRHTLPSTGVPDLGAYEFTPNAGVIPPTCAVTPAAPVAGGTQTYTFGYDTVATITWDAAAIVPGSAPTVRQYSGVAPPGLNALNPTFMYFYTDISSTNADYTSNTYYKDPWIGTIATENALHLAKKDGANPWVGYPITVSTANTARNFIRTPNTGPLNTFGWYTGIDVGNNAAVTALVDPSGTFCPGTYPIRVKIANNGNNVITGVKIDWQLDGIPKPQITYSTPIPYNNGTPGSNEVVITLDPGVVFGTTPHTVKVWTSLPNNTTDPIPADDTLGILTVRSALAGDYTVGAGTPAPDFPDLVTAVSTLQVAGMCGPVTLKMRAGTYAGQVNIQNIPGSSAANRLTIREDVGVQPIAVNVTYGAGTGTGNDHVIMINNTSYVTIKNISVNNTTTGFYGTCIELNGTSMGDSILNCNLTSNNTTSSTYLCGMYSNNAKFDNLVIQGNTISASLGLYPYAGAANTPGLVIENNNINAYYMGMYYIYNTAGAKVNYNTITAGGGSTVSSPGGIYYWYISNATPIQCIGNKVSDYYYGIYIYYPSGTAANRSVVNNNIVTFNRSSITPYYGMFVYGPSYTNVNHNSVAIGGNTYTYTYTGYIYLSSYQQDSVYNNTFSCYNTGYAFYSYIPTGYGHRLDFNNLYTTGTSLIYDGAGTYANMTALRLSTYATGNGNAWSNSINYNPDILNTGGIPNPSSPNCWALNGRGLQLPYANKDYNGASRVTNRANGVPDIGAIEFDPAVAPPASTPTPSVAAPGVSQTFTFGETTVGTVKWNTQLAITSPLNVMQYSGAVPPANFPTVSQNKYPYFYTDIKPTGLASTYDFDVTVNYYDTWLGTIPNETNMKLAHKFGATPWISYNQANSSTNTTANTIFAAGVTSFGAYTGIDDGVNFSANVKVLGSTILCTGNSVTLNASPVSSGSTTYTYQWRRNGSDIAGANGNTYTVTTGGDYTVLITATSVTPVLTSESIPVTVTVVAPPMAVVNASGALTFCNGSNLLLDAGNVPGVTYQWKLNGVNIAGATGNTYQVTGAGSYSVVTTNIGCSSTSTNTLVNAGPIVVNLGADIAACEIKNTPYILDAGYPGAKYLWSTGDTTQTIQVFKGTGVYSVTVDAGPNCIGTDQVSVNLNPLPYASGINYIRTGNTYTFTPSGTTNTNTYLWMFGDGTTSNYKTVVKTFEGSMTVKLVVGNDCGKDTITMVQWATGVNGVVNENLDANVYPNPASDKVTLSVKGTTMKDVAVLNALGEVVYRAEIDGTSTEHSLNVGAFANGRYIIRATTPDGIISKPFNIQR